MRAPTNWNPLPLAGEGRVRARERRTMTATIQSRRPALTHSLSRKRERE
jgi:hypothetical protein